MVLAVAPDKADEAMKVLEAAGETVYRIGEIKAGEKGVVLC